MFFAYFALVFGWRRKIKITCFIDNLSAGGAQRQIVMLATLLQESGHEVTMLTYYPHDFFLNDIVDSGIKYLCMNEPRPLLRVFKTRKALNSLNQDLVIAFLKTPVLLAELSCVPWKKWKLLVSERNADTSKDKKLIFRRMLHIFSNYIVVNSYTNQRLLNKNARWLKNVKTIYNCVDSDYFSPNLNNRHLVVNGKMKIVAIGKYSDQKNITGLIQAAHYIMKNHNFDLRIDWYGDKIFGNKVYDMAKDMIKKLGVEHLFFLHNPNKLILNVYRESSLMILPSFYEGVPNVICEAMSCGLPVLASDINDNSRFITNEENGYLFNPHDPIDISNSIIKFYKLPESSKKEMGFNSRKKAEEMFSRDVFIREYLKIINAL